MITISSRLVALTLAASAAAVCAQPVSITETFRNDTAPGWSLLGDARLTSSSGDPTGDGWLELTSAATYKKGTAIYNTPFSSTDGLDIEFSYATYGGTLPTGADGISFYLIDGATATPTLGAYGGGLGYAFHHTNAGVTNGYVALGLDEWGNFANNSTGQCTVNPGLCGAGGHNRLVVRGSGSLNTGFELLHNIPLAIATTNRAGAKRVRIIMTPGPNVTLSAYIDGTAVINNLPLSTGGTPAAGMASLPATFKMGLAASTGAAINRHEIRNMRVRQARLTAANDTYATTPGTPLTVNAEGGAGSNDTGVLPTATFTVTTPPPASSGTLVMNPDGSFTFTPAPNFSGSATATYQVCNPPGGAANCRTATITFTAPASAAVPVPTLSHGSLMLMGLAAAGLGARRLRRKA